MATQDKDTSKAKMPGVGGAELTTEKAVEAAKELTSADYYFNSYAHFGIHEEMLKDEVRTNAYRKAIMNNKHLFRDKIVLDVGCGTGILCMFAAKAGAKQVYGIECSDIVESARQIVADNGLSDKVTLIQGKVEDVKLPVDKVDIILSEWMGYCLLYESMLHTVIYARDKWLVEGGLLYPNKSTMYIGAIEDGDYRSEKIGWWDNVYGFDMKAIKQQAMMEPLVDVVDPNAICTNIVPLQSFDLLEADKSHSTFTVPFRMRARRNDYVHALLVYWDATFTQCHKPVYFSTGPHVKATHWKQTVFYLDETITISEGEELSGTFSCTPNTKNPRDLDIEISYSFKGQHSVVEAKQFYRLR